MIRRSIRYILRQLRNLAVGTLRLLARVSRAIGLTAGRLIRASIRFLVPALTWLVVAPLSVTPAIIATSISFVVGSWLANSLPRKDEELRVTKLRWFRPKRHVFFGTAGTRSLADFSFKRAWQARRQPAYQVRLGLGDTWIGAKPQQIERTSKSGRVGAAAGVALPLAIGYGFLSWVSAADLSSFGNAVIKWEPFRSVFGNWTVNNLHHYLFTRGSIIDINNTSSETLRFFPITYSAGAFVVAVVNLVGTVFVDDSVSESDLNVFLLDCNSDIDLNLETLIMNNHRSFERLPKAVQAKVKARLNVSDNVAHNLITEGVLREAHTVGSKIRYEMPASQSGIQGPYRPVALNTKVTTALEELINRDGFSWRNTQDRTAAARIAVEGAPEVFNTRERESQGIDFLSKSSDYTDFSARINVLLFQFKNEDQYTSDQEGTAEPTVDVTKVVEPEAPGEVFEPDPVPIRTERVGLYDVPILGETELGTDEAVRRTAR